MSDQVDDGDDFTDAVNPPPDRTTTHRECPASHFWLCIAIWVIIGLVDRGPLRHYLHDLSGWRTILALPFILAAGVLLVVFSIAGMVIPAQYLEERMRRSERRAIRERADHATLIWMIVVGLYLWAVFPSR